MAESNQQTRMQLTTPSEEIGWLGKVEGKPLESDYLELSAKEDGDSRAENPLPISGKKFERSNQHKNKIPSTEHGETGTEFLAQSTKKLVLSREFPVKEKTNRKKTKRKLVKQEALRQKRKSETTGLEILRLPSCLRYMDFSESQEEMTMRWVRLTTSPIICPPYDLAATTLEAAYPLQKIISDDEWDCLLDVLNLSNAGEKVSFDVYPLFVCNRVHKLDNIKDEKEKRKLAGIFSFIAHLVRFHHFYKGVEDTIPDKLFKRFSSLFTPKHNLGRYRLVVFYILVLTLHADNFKTNLKDITVDLRCIKSMTKDFYRCLGCEVVEEEKITLATLSLPLQFPRSVSMVEPDESRVPSED